MGITKNFLEFCCDVARTLLFRWKHKSTHIIMKLLKYFIAVAALTGALTLSAQAHLQFLGFTDFASQHDNNPDTNKEALGNFLDQDVSNFALCGNFEDLSGSTADVNIDVMAGSFLVVHYGGPKGGSLEFF